MWGRNVSDRSSGARAIDEAARLAELDSYAPETLLDDSELNAITAFASKLAGTPTARVSLVEADRQFFVSREGLDATETPRGQSFCQHAMLMDRVMEVPDATQDPRFADNGLVTGAPHIRFYAGAPLVGEDGAPLGALCVISPEARPEGLSEFQREGLTVLAAAVMRRMRDRRAHLARLSSEARFQGLSNAIPQMAWSTTPDGKVEYLNERWAQFTGTPVNEHHGDGWVEALHPDDVPVALEAWTTAVNDQTPYEVEYRLRRHDGQWRWTLARGLPQRDADGMIERWFGTNTDIHERKILEEDRDLLSRELGHRIKNIFSLIAGLLHLEGKSDPSVKPAMDAVSGRIGALGRAHDHVRPDRMQKGEVTHLHRLLTELFAPYDLADEPRMTVSGDDLVIREEAVSPLALIFHELATNAAKYGALSVSGGTVTIDIEANDETTRFTWREQGGPGTREADMGPTGFGSTLIGLAVERQLGGTLERCWQEDGLNAVVEVPTKRLASSRP